MGSHPLNANFQVYLTSIKALYISRQRLAWQELLPSSAYHAVGSQADNFFHLVPRHTHSTIPSRLPTHTIERERGTLIKQVMPERGFVSLLDHHRPSSSRRTNSFLFLVDECLVITLLKPLSTSSSSSGDALVRCDSVGVNGGGFCAVRRAQRS